MIAQGLPIAAALFLLFPRLASPLWGLPADRARVDGPVRSHVAGLDQRAGAERRRRVPRRFRRHGRRPPRARYWRGPVLSRFNGREWRSAVAAARRQVRRPATRPTIDYTVTLEPNDHPWLFALDFPAALPEIDSDTGTRGRAGGLRRLFARAAAADARAA